MKNFFLGFLLAATLLGAYDHVQKNETLIKLNNMYEQKIILQNSIIQLQESFINDAQTPAQPNNSSMFKDFSKHTAKIVL